MKKHAICILAHKNWEQLDDLVGVLESQYSDVYLHIDKKRRDIFNRSSIQDAINIYDEYKIQNAIIAVANKGGYTIDLSSLRVGQPYLDYLKELGYTITTYKNNSIGIYVEWSKKIKI